MTWGCMCGALDCPDCGPAQGYEVIRVRKPGGGWRYINPDHDERADYDDEPPSWVVDQILEERA